MSEFLNAIPAAASSPYALVAYAIAAVLFLLAGARLRMAKLLLERIEAVPENERRRALEIATGTVLPTSISPEQWIRISRLRWTFLLLGSLLIAILAVATIAIINPTKQAMQDIKKTTEETAQRTQVVVQEGTERIVSTVQDAALATLETMFPLAVRIDREVDGTIMHLDGSPKQRLISYDNNMKPMKLHWGDRFHFFAYSEGQSKIAPSSQVSLEVVSGTKATQLPLRLDTYSEQEIRIPGSSPEPMEAYFINESGVRGIALKITIYSADRERGREDFRKALMNTSLDSAARRIYLEVHEDGVRLRNSNSESATILRTIRQGTYVKVKERSTNNEWCQIRLPEGREGWIKCNFLSPIASSSK